MSDSEETDESEEREELDEELEWEDDDEGEWEEANEWDEDKVGEEENFTPSSEREDKEVEDVIARSSVSNDRPPLAPFVFRVPDEKMKEIENGRKENAKKEENRTVVQDRVTREAQRVQKREAEKRRIQLEIQKIRKLRTEGEEGVIRDQQEKLKEGQEQWMRERLHKEESTKKRREEEEAIIQQEIEKIRRLRELQAARR
jgi:hypothetical protein